MKSKSTGIGFSGILFIVLLVFVILDKISFWWLLIPAFPLVIAFGFLVFAGIVMILFLLNK